MSPGDSAPPDASATCSVAASAASAASAAADAAADSDTESAAPVDSDADPAAAARADPEADPAPTADSGTDSTATSSSASPGDSVAAGPVAADPAAVADSGAGSAAAADAATAASAGSDGPSAPPGGAMLDVLDSPLLNSGLRGPSVHIFPAGGASHGTTTTEATTPSAMTAATAPGTIIVIRNNGQPSDRAHATATATSMRASASWAGAVTVVYDAQSNADANMAVAAANGALGHATAASNGNYVLGYVGSYDYDVPPGSPAPVLPSDTVPAPPGASHDDGGGAAPVPTPTPPADAAASVSPGSSAPAPPAPPGSCDPAPAPPPASGIPGVPHLVPRRLDQHIPHRIAPADSTLAAAGTPGAPGTAQGNADTDDGARATAAAVTMERGGVAGTLHHDETNDDGTAQGSADTGDGAGATAAANDPPPVSPGNAAPAPPAPPDGSAPAPPSSLVLTLSGGPAPRPPAGPTPPEPPDSPVPVPPSDPAPAPLPAAGTPDVPHLFLRRLDARIPPPVDNSLTATGAPGTPDTAQASAGTNNDAGATATVGNHGDADGDAALADAAPLSNALGTPLVGALTGPHVAAPTPLTDDMNAVTGNAILPAAPSDPPAPATEPILDHAATTTAATWAAATTTLTLHIGPPEPLPLQLHGEEANDGAALSRSSSHAHASAWSTAIILSASAALLAPAIPSAFFAQPSHSSHVARSNADRSCCLCVATLTCLAVCTGLAEHVSSWAGGALILAQLPSQQQILAPSPPAQNPASYAHELSDGQLACGPRARPVPCQQILAPSPPARNPASYAHALPGEQLTCGPRAQLTGSLHEGGVRSVHSLPQQQLPAPNTASDMHTLPDGWSILYLVAQLLLLAFLGHAALFRWEPSHLLMLAAGIATLATLLSSTVPASGSRLTLMPRGLRYPVSGSTSSVPLGNLFLSALPCFLAQTAYATTPSRWHCQQCPGLHT